MKSFAKNLLKKTVPAVLAAGATAAVVADHPATQPATQPAARPALQVQRAQNNLPLVIPDGTSGPVVQRDNMLEFQSMGGIRQ